MSNDIKIKRAVARLHNMELDGKKIAQDLADPKYMKDLGNFAAGLVKKRTRLGSGVKQHGAQKEKLKPLSEGYVEQRRKDKDAGILSEFTNVKKSNLVRTGQLTDSIKVKDVTPRTARIGPSGHRTDGKTNQKVGEFVTDAGRPFNNLSNAEVKQIGNRIRRDVKAAIKKRLMK